LDNFYIDKVNNIMFSLINTVLYLSDVFWLGSWKEDRQFVDACNHLQRVGEKTWDCRRWICFLKYQ
jgi:hypothetical protein